MSFSKRPGKNTPQCYTKPLDSLKNWNNRFFWVDERVFPTSAAWRTSAPKDSMPLEGTYAVEDVAILNARRTPIQKQPETLLCLVGLSRRYFLGDDVYPIFLHDDGREMDLFNLISARNPTVIKTGTRARTAHEVPRLTVIASRQIDMEESAATSKSSGAPSTIERSPLDFPNENPSEQINEGNRAEDQGPETMASLVPPVGPLLTTRATPNIVEEEETVADAPHVSKRRRKRENEESNANAPRKVLRKDFDVSHLTQSTVGGESLASIRLGASSTVSAPTSQKTPAGTMNPDPISFVKPLSVPEQDIAQSSKGATAAGGPELDPTSPTMVMSPGSIYQPEWGVTNGCLLDTPSSCQELVDYLAPPVYFSELHHLPNEDFLGQVNMTLARKVAMGSQLRLRFEQEAKLLRKYVAQVARRDQRIQAMEGEKKNLETLLEAEADMRKAAEAKNAELAQVTGEEKIKSTFEEFKKYEGERVSTLCAEMDSRLDAYSIDFDEELYPHMLTVIAGRRWVIGHILRLAVLKCAESLELRQTFANVLSAEITKGFCDGLKYEVEQGEAKLDLAIVEGYDLKAEGKFIATMQALKDLKYPLIDELENLRDSPMDVLMASLYLESDTGKDAPNGSAVKEEKLLGDAIAANESRAEKKKICKIVCRTHGVDPAHHARSDGIPVSVPTVVPQGLAILLADATTQMDVPEEESSLKLTRSKSMSSMYNLD
ncbi:hypothetical protein Tco_0135226 [Tanacetum coccineum]